MINNQDDLITRLQGRYKKNYTKVQIEDIKDWLTKDGIEDKWLPRWYDLLTENFTFLPQRKDFYDFKFKLAMRQAEMAWEQLSTLKVVRSIFCTDMVMQETIKSMGGIDEFISYRNKDNHWCRERFIKRYVWLLQMNALKDKKPEVIRCEYELQFPKFPPERFVQTLTIIGNQTEGRRMLQEGKVDGTLIEYKQKKSEIKKNVKSLENILKEVL